MSKSTNPKPHHDPKKSRDTRREIIKKLKDKMQLLEKELSEKKEQLQSLDQIDYFEGRIERVLTMRSPKSLQYFNPDLIKVTSFNNNCKSCSYVDEDHHINIKIYDRLTFKLDDYDMFCSEAGVINGVSFHYDPN